MPSFPRPRFLLATVAVLAAAVVGASPVAASAHVRPKTTTTSLGSSTSAATSSASSGTGSASSPLCTPAALQSARQTVAQALSNRSTQLQTLMTRVSNTKDISSADASALDTIISNEQTGIADGGISGLASMVPDATTCREVLAAARTMVLDFRVYALVSPQVDLTAVASTESTLVTQTTALEPKIQSAITAAQGVAPT